MKCPKCGAENPDNGDFCNSCGAGLKGAINPTLTKDAKAEFKEEIKKIYLQHLLNVKNVERPAKVNEYIRKMEQEKKKEVREHREAPMALESSIFLSICLIPAAVFCFLIPGINYGNENFRFLADSYFVSIWMSCMVGLIPILIMAIVGLFQEGEMTVGRFFGLLAAVPAVGFVLYLLVLLIQKVIAIVLAGIIIVVCAILLITSIAGSDSYRTYAATKDRVGEYERAIERHRQQCYDDLKRKYQGLLSAEDMKSAIFVAEGEVDCDMVQNPYKYI